MAPIPLGAVSQKRSPRQTGEAQAGQRALHTGTSWYAYAAIFGSSNQLHPIYIGSLFIAWPYFVSHNRWLKYNYSIHLHLNRQVLALRLALLRPDPLVRV